MRTAHPPAPFTAKLAWLFAAVFFVALLIAITPNVLDTLARFGLVHGAAAPPAQIHTLAIPTYAPAPIYSPPVTSQEPPQAPLRANSAPAVGVPVSAPTAAPVAPAGINIIVVKPADGSAPIVLRDGTKYRGRP